MSQKKSFVVYESWATMIANLPEETAGELIKAICCARVGQEYEFKDQSAKAMYIMIYPQIEKDSGKYEETKKRRQDAAAKRWLAEHGGADAEQDDAEEAQTDANDVQNDANAMQMHTVSDSVSVSVSGSVSGSVSEHPTDAKKKSAKTRSPRHKHGEYGHVLLTQEQYNSLCSKHGDQATARAIDKVDKYCEETGKTYKNYALVIERWGYEPDRKARSGTTEQFNADDYLLGIINGERSIDDI